MWFQWVLCMLLQWYSSRQLHKHPSCVSITVVNVDSTVNGSLFTRTTTDKRDSKTHSCSLMIRHTLCPHEVSHSVHEVILLSGTTLLLLVEGKLIAGAECSWQPAGDFLSFPLVSCLDTGSGLIMLCLLQFLLS